MPKIPILKDPVEMQRLYTSLQSTRAVAKHLGVWPGTVYKALRALGIPMRPPHAHPVALPKRGYRTAQVKRPGGSELLHRQIMEAHLGRVLEPVEHVHHIDGNPLNNDLSNLMVLHQSDHFRLHETNYTHQCLTCGQTFKGGNRALRCPECRTQNERAMQRARTKRYRAKPA